MAGSTTSHPVSFTQKETPEQSHRSGIQLKALLQISYLS